jgi:hypothetical protein
MVHPTTFSRSAPAAAALLALVLADLTSAQQVSRECRMYVTEEGPGNVHEFHGVSGAPLGIFNPVPISSAQIMAIHTGAPGQHVLVGARGGGVRELDRNTGALIKIFNPGGGWQWAGIYAPSGEVLIGDMSTTDIRRYDATTAAYLGPFGLVPGPADMVFGPNGNLFVCSYGSGGVYELDGTTGNFIAHHVPTVGLANDILFMPDGRRIVTSNTSNMAHVFDSSWNPVTTFQGTGWQRPHGLDRSPHDGHIYVVDGVTNAVHKFDSTTYMEINATFAFVESKLVDVEFRIPNNICGAVVVVGPGCGGLTIGHSGLADIGTTLTMRLSGAPLPGLQALLAIGLSNQFWNGLLLPLPLDPLGAHGCTLHIGPIVTRSAAVEPGGTAATSLRVPSDPGLIGGRLYMQWIAPDARNALGLSVSSAAMVLLGG